MSGADEDAGQTSRRKAGDGAASESQAKPTRTRARAKKVSATAGPDLGSDKLYFKIGEVAQIVGVPAYVLRYWETEFKVIRPQKSRTQQRVYRRRDVETLLKIKHLLYAKKFTIAGRASSCASAVTRSRWRRRRAATWRRSRWRRCASRSTI
ncbi:MerR family transcriptional regulator [Nannocystis pusilla]|uniref:MerR family transcriptional regulator n=1 Tax=Nannocystis pusilla TaxID=889268 RepID=UPI003B76561E